MSTAITASGPIDTSQNEEDGQVFVHSMRPTEVKTFRSLSLFFLSYGFDCRSFHRKSVEQEHAEAMLRKTDLLQGTDRLRSLCFRLSKKRAFKVSFFVLITLNVFLIGFEAHLNLDIAQAGTEVPKEVVRTLWGFGQAFTGLFVVEIFVRTVGCPKLPWQDNWLVVDSFIVFLAVVEDWVIGPATMGEWDDTLEATGVLRVVRMLRALRVIRVVRMFRFAWELRVIAEALGHAFVTIFWMFVMFTMCLGCFAVACVTVFKDILQEHLQETESGEEELLSGGVAYLMVTFSMILVQGIQWSPIFAAARKVHIAFGLVLLAFILFALISLLNLIVGTFVGSILSATSDDESLISANDNSETYDNLKKLISTWQPEKDLIRNNPQPKEDDLVSFEDFEADVNSQPELCEKLGFHPEQAPEIFRLANKDLDTPANVEDLVMAVFKAARMTKSVDMLTVDWNQGRIQTKVDMLADDYDRGMARTFRLLHDVDVLVGGINEDLQSLVGVAQPGTDSANLCVEGGRRTQSHDPEETMLQSLNGRYEFSTRLRKVEAKIQEVADAQSGNVSSGPGFATAATPFMWRVLFSEEVMPWLRWELARFPAPNANGPLATTAEPDGAREAAILAFRSALGPAQRPAEDDALALGDASTARSPPRRAALLPTRAIDAAGPWRPAR